MATTAFASIEHYDMGDSERPEDTGDVFVDCTLEPFVFTWENDANDLLPRFKEWIDQRLAIALREWGQYLA